MDKKLLLAPVLIILLSGCVATAPVNMQGLTSPKSFLVSDIKNVDYPGFLAAAGNIYSCRYGIYYKTPSEFNPPRDVIFAGLLYKYLPVIEKHKVVLTQFDVYYNTRLKQLHNASGALGGGVASSIALDASRRGNYGFMDKNLLVDSVPETFPFKTEEVSVGCDNANEGEYFPSRVSGGHDVVVSWFKFSIDGKEYHFRSLYQFQPETKDAIQEGVAKAIDRSLREISSKLKI